MAHNRAFYAALGVSIVFHLSMVTVFSIVIFFPREVVDYYSVSIVEPDRQPPRPAPTGDRLRVPSPADAPSLDDLVNGNARGVGRGEPEADWAELPEIELPTLEFAELKRLRAREEGLAMRSERESLLNPQPRDAWARFGEELGQLGHALSSTLRLSGEKDDLEEPVQIPVTRPAAGFEAYIEWVGEPRDRKLLFAPPIQGLWGVPLDTLDRPMVIEFTVNPEGRVVSSWSPQIDETDLVTSAQASLLKYRFEPIDGDHVQQATLHVMAARDGL